jgi:type IV pilus assembly protein PilO
MEDAMQFGFREMIFTSLLLGLVAGTYATIVQPHARARQEKLAEIRSMDAAISAIGGSTAAFVPLAGRVDEEQAREALFEARLTSQADAQKGVDEVLQTAAANSLQAGEALLLKPTEAGGLRAQPINFHFTGNFNGFYSFLLQLESMPRVIRISRLDLKGADDRDGQMQADMTLTMYFDSRERLADAK